MAAEAASLRISMEAISLGFKSLMVDVFIPSTMYKGSLLPLEPVPRTRILTPAPGEPDTGNTDIPAVFPCMACSTRPTAPRSRSSGFGKTDINYTLIVNGNLLGQKAHKGEFEHVGRTGIYGVSPFHIGDGSTQGAFHHHVNPGQRFALKVTNDTAYGVGFLTQSGQTKKKNIKLLLSSFSQTTDSLVF